MAFTTGLIVGLFAGALLGVVILSLMVISHRSGEREERMKEEL